MREDRIGNRNSIIIDVAGVFYLRSPDRDVTDISETSDDEPVMDDVFVEDVVSEQTRISMTRAETTMTMIERTLLSNHTMARQNGPKRFCCIRRFWLQQSIFELSPPIGKGITGSIEL